MFSLNPLPAALKLEMPSEAFLHASLISIYKPYKSKQRGWILKSYAKIQQIIKFCKFFCTKSTFFYKKNAKKFGHVRRCNFGLRLLRIPPKLRSHCRANTKYLAKNIKI